MVGSLSSCFAAVNEAFHDFGGSQENRAAVDDGHGLIKFSVRLAAGTAVKLAVFVEYDPSRQCGGVEGKSRDVLIERRKARRGQARPGRINTKAKCWAMGVWGVTEGGKNDGLARQGARNDGVGGRGVGLRLAAHFSPVTHLDHEQTHYFIADIANDSVVSHAVAPEGCEVWAV